MKVRGESVELVTASIAWLEITKGLKKGGGSEKWKGWVKKKPVEKI